MLPVAQHFSVRLRCPAVTSKIHTAVANLRSLHTARRQEDNQRTWKRPQPTLQTVKSHLCGAVATTPSVLQMPESVVQGLQPQALWDFFQALTQIPRPSKFEDK